MGYENLKRRFVDKVVLVTGGGSGLGLTMVEAFVEEGANVVVTGRRPDVLDAVARRFPDQVAIFSADVAKSVDCNKAIAFAVERFGGLDVLVNNAGYFAFKPFEEVTDDDVMSSLLVNQAGVIYMTRAALPHLVKSKGNVVSLSSISIRRGFPKLSIYAGTKAAVEQMTHDWAVELGPKGVRFNAVAPGLSGHTDMTKLWDDDGLEAPTIAMTPLGRRGTERDIANSVLFLASDDGSWVTGQCIDCAGGLFV